MKIYIKVHPDSSEEMFKILDCFHADEAAPRGVQLIISKITD